MSVPARREFGSVLATAAVAGALALSAGGRRWALGHRRPARRRCRRSPSPSWVPTPPRSCPPPAWCCSPPPSPCSPCAGSAGWSWACSWPLAGGVLAWSGVRALTGGLPSAPRRLPGVGSRRTPGPVHVDAPRGRCSRLLAGVLGVVAGLLASSAGAVAGHGTALRAGRRGRLPAAHRRGPRPGRAGRPSTAATTRPARPRTRPGPRTRA